MLDETWGGAMEETRRAVLEAKRGVAAAPVGEGWLEEGKEAVSKGTKGKSGAQRRKARRERRAQGGGGKSEVRPVAQLRIVSFI
jgi:hypothetical protein